MNRLVSLFVAFLFVLPTIACINEYHTRLDGSVYLADKGSGRIVRARIDRAKARENAKNLLEIYHRSIAGKTALSNSMTIYSDYGVQLIYLGEYERAKQVYREIERRWPHRYRTASNLGTVYELLGQNDSALVWIRKAVTLNPGSHDGSEWIHIRILKWKLRQQHRQPDVTLLGIGFGTEELPSNPYKLDLDELYTHLERQLQERTKLVPPKDAIIGRLYFDLGNVVAQRLSAEDALPYYRAALEYGYDTPLLQTRIAAMKELAGSFSIERWLDEHKETLIDYFWLIALSGLVFMTGCVVILRRLIKRRRRRIKMPGR